MNDIIKYSEGKINIFFDENGNSIIEIFEKNFNQFIIDYLKEMRIGVEN